MAHRTLHLVLLYSSVLTTAGTDPASWTSIDFFARLAERAEAGRFDALFRADGVDIAPMRDGSRPNPELDPQILLAALSRSTSRLGLVATVSTTFSHPYNVARSLGTLDHVSGGRVGWNVVTSQRGDGNFGLAAMPPQAERYARATEFVLAADRLWHSWRDVDQAGIPESGRIDFKGRHFSIQGPLTFPTPPQGRPVLFQAGSSEIGRAFGTRFADVVFATAATKEQALGFTADIGRRCAADPRRSAGARVLFGIKTFIGDDEREARALYERSAAAVDLQLGRQALERLLGGLDLRRFAPDDIVPASAIDVDVTTLSGRQSLPQLLIELAATGRYTLADLIRVNAMSSGHFLAVGTPAQVAATILDWHESGAADGFVVMPSDAGRGLDDFVGKVVPILQSSGLFRRDYEGNTLRDHLGLPAAVPFEQQRLTQVA